MAQQTDLELFLAMLDRNAVSYSTDKGEPDAHWEATLQAGETGVYIEEWGSGIGYHGFGACFKFDANGKLIGVGGSE